MSRAALVLQRTVWVLVGTILMFTGLPTPAASAESVPYQSKLFVADQLADYVEVRLKMTCNTSVSQIQDEYESQSGGRHLGSTQVDDNLKLTVEGTVELRAGVAANLARDFPAAAGMPDTYRGTPIVDTNPVLPPQFPLSEGLLSVLKMIPDVSQIIRDAMGDELGNVKTGFYTRDHDLKISMSGGGSFSAWRNHRVYPPDGSGLGRWVTDSAEGSWSYSTSSPRLGTDDDYPLELDIEPRDDGSLKYKLIIASPLTCPLDDRLEVTGTSTSRHATWEGSYVYTDTYPNAWGWGFASGTASETILGMDDQIEGDLAFQNGRFYASGSIRYTHEPPSSTSRNTRGTTNSTVELEYEIEIWPTPREVQVNQALARYDYKDEREYQPATEFVAGKNTAVHAFFADCVPVSQLQDVKLEIRRDGSPVATLTTYTLDTDNNALLFIPRSKSEVANWAAGRYDFVVKIGQSEFMESGVEFKESRKLRILLIPIDIKIGNHIAWVNLSGSWRQADQFLRKVYPISEEDVEVLINTVWDLSATSWHLNTEEMQRALAEALNNAATAGNDRYDAVVGVVGDNIPDSGPEGYVLGYTYPGMRSVVVSANDPAMAETLAHEIGHLFGLGDEYEGGAIRCDVNPPPASYSGRNWYNDSQVGRCSRSDEQPSPLGSGVLIPKELLAMDVAIGTIRTGDSIGYMGTASSPGVSWTTPLCWKHLYRVFTGYQEQLNQAKAGDGAKTAKRAVRVYGAVDASGNATIDTANLSIEHDVVVDESSGGYMVRILDAAGRTISSQKFDPERVVLSDPPKRLPVGVFSVLLPLSTGSKPSRIQVLRPGQVLAEIDVSMEPGSVEVTSPGPGTHSGEILVAWKTAAPPTPAAPGPSTTYYSVEYSPNGDQWYLLCPNTTETSLTVDLDRLPGGTAAVIRVTARCGVATTQAYSERFTVPDKPPVAYIEHADVSQDDVILTGYAYDLLDGTIYDEARLAWSSDLDGEIGRGNLVFADSLTPGRHTITLTATNSRGLASVATVSVTINER